MRPSSQATSTERTRTRGGRADAVSDAAAPALPGAPLTPPPLSTVLPLRRWSEALAEAAEHRRPLLVLAEPSWTTGAQRLAWFLAREDGLRSVCEAGWVACHVDPWDEPDVATSLRFEATVLTGEPGPPLLVMLDDAGEPFMAFGTLAFEGGDGVPSLRSLLEAGAAVHRDERERLRAEADARRAQRRDPPAAIPVPGGRDELADVILKRFDPVYGGVPGATKEPLPHALLALLDAADGAQAEVIDDQLERTLLHLARGGIRDQVWHGFHRAARDDGWVVPHFEKLVPANAALAQAFAVVGQRQRRQDRIDLAEATLTWVTLALEAGVDAVEADTGYYTWTPQEVRRVVTPDVLQVLGIHYHITPNPSRHVLYQAVAQDDLHAHAHEDQETLTARLALGREQLRQARQGRRTPATHASPRTSWRADAVIMALACAEALDHDPTRLLAVADRVAAEVDAADGSTAPTHDPAITWFEDRAALAHLLAVVGRSTGTRGWTERANDLVADVLERWPRDGAAFALRAPAAASDPTSSVAVLDAATASPVSHLLAALRITRPGDAELRRAIVSAHATTASLDVARSAAFWREALLCA